MPTDEEIDVTVSRLWLDGKDTLANMLLALKARAKAAETERDRLKAFIESHERSMDIIERAAAALEAKP